MIPMSYSRIRDAQCPFRFKTIHIDKSEKEPETPQMIIGRDFAQVVEQYRKRALQAGKVTSHEIMREVENELYPKFQYPNEVEELVRKFYMGKYFHVPTYAEYYTVEDKIALDHNFNVINKHEKEFDNWMDKDALFRLKLDLAYVYRGNLYILDDKTGFGDIDEMQGEIYAGFTPLCLPQEIYNKVHNIVVVFNQVAKRDITVMPNSGGYGYTLEDAKKKRENIYNFIEYIDSLEDYPPEPGPLCYTCKLQSCPIYKQEEKNMAEGIQQHHDAQVYLPQSLESQEDAENAIKFLVFADKIKSNIKKLLHDYHKEYGPVSSIGRETVEKENDKWQPKDIKSIIDTLAAYAPEKESMKEDIFNTLDIKEDDIDQICRKHGIEDKSSLIKAYGERKRYSPKFTIQKERI